MNPPYIRTERTTLRPPHPEDAIPLHEAFSDPEVMRYWSTPPHTDLAETQAWWSAAMMDPKRELTVVHNHKVIGRIGFWRDCEIGFLFVKRIWGQGLAAEAIRAACGYGFEELGYTEIVADVDPRNERCLRVLESCGFTRTGTAERTWNVAGEWCDSVYLSLPCSVMPDR